MRVKYAVVGNNVNLAGRVESFTVGGQLLITESCLKATSLKVMVRAELSVPFKGLKNPVNVYDVVGVSGDYELMLPQSESVFVSLVDKLDTVFEILDGKSSSGDRLHGEIVEISEKSAIFYSETELVGLANLKIMISDNGGLAESISYAKVMRKDQPSHYEIRFTFMPAEIRTYFDRFLNV
jgi:adenylate cyclase